MGLFQVEGSMNVDMKKYVCIGVGQRVLRIHCLIMLVNSKTFMKERDEHKTGRESYVQIVIGHGMERRLTLVPGPGTEGEAKALGRGRSGWRELVMLQGPCRGIRLERPQLISN